jgi:hypothetical protein
MRAHPPQPHFIKFQGLIPPHGQSMPKAEGRKDNTNRTKRFLGRTLIGMPLRLRNLVSELHSTVLAVSIELFQSNEPFSGRPSRMDGRHHMWSITAFAAFESPVKAISSCAARTIARTRFSITTMSCPIRTDFRRFTTLRFPPPANL